MKQRCEIVIAVPRDQVVALFDDPDNVLKWQPDLFVQIRALVFPIVLVLVFVLSEAVLVVER